MSIKSNVFGTASIVDQMKPCIQKPVPLAAVKFTPDMISGYSCVKTGCGRFDTTCEECDWNTHTPYITLGGTNYYMGNQGWSFASTGFSSEDNFYIVKNESNDRYIFVSADHFAKTYEFK